MNKHTAIHIVGGTGKMGNWLKNFLDSQGLSSVSVSGRKKAEKEVFVKAEIVFVSVPISIAPQVIQEVSGFVSKDCLLIDLSSVMGETSKTLQNLPNPSICLHFLFGPTVSSIQNQNCVVSEIRKNDLGQEFVKILKDAGAIVSELSPIEHDKKMAILQNVTHFLNISLAKLLLEEKIDLSGKLSTPVFLSQLSTLSRVVSQDTSLLAEIQLNNPQAEKTLEDFLLIQNNLLDKIKVKDLKKLSSEIDKVHNAIDPSKSKDIKSPKEALGDTRVEGKIAFLGPEGTFSHQAVKKVLSKGEEVACNNLREIFEKVKLGDAEWGVVPAENSTEGTIRETLDYLVENNLQTYGSVFLPVHQCLLSKEKDIKKIKKVISHPQALGQVRDFLHQSLPWVSTESANSTISAAKDLSPETALVGPEIAAALYGLNVLAKDIEDNKENVTRFYLIGKPNASIPFAKRTLIFLTVFNRVGVLKDILGVLASFNINLSKIESRPSKEKMWDYCFYVEVEASQSDPRLVSSLNVLRQYCPDIKILGGV